MYQETVIQRLLKKDAGANLDMDVLMHPYGYDADALFKEARACKKPLSRGKGL
jgi:hypothetical protein